MTTAAPAFGLAKLLTRSLHAVSRLLTILATIMISATRNAGLYALHHSAWLCMHLQANSPDCLASRSVRGRQ